jgi:lipopolysaccharide export system protein LptA
VLFLTVTQNCKILVNLKTSSSKFATLLLPLLFHLNAVAQQVEKESNLGTIPIDNVQDSLNIDSMEVPPGEIPIIPDTLIQDSLQADSLSGDTLAPKSDVKTTVFYNARDSIITDIVNRKAYLYGDAKVTYGDIELTADRISINWEINELEAAYSLDSAGEIVGKPVFTEGKETFEADKIRYNFKSKKGIVSGVITQQGEGFVHGERVKVNEKNESFIDDALYTTCNLPDPHFRIRARKIKMIPEKRVITGPFNIVINDVPTPLGFAFGLFPIPKEKASGIIVPKYGESRDRGFFLREGGYYWAIGDYVGLKILGEIYTNGSYGLQFNNAYKKRYGFDGNMNFRFNKRIEGEDEEQTVLEDFWFKWQHRPAQKGTYGGRFSADVSLGSQNFNERNSFNINELQSATFNSNVTYSKAIRNTPFSFNTSLRQSQNTQTGVMDLTLPDFNLAMARQSPFKKIKGLRKIDLLNKFNLSYNGSLRNQLDNRLRNTTSVGGVTVRNGVNEREGTDSQVFKANGENAGKMWDRKRLGVKHTIPISTSMKLFKYFNLNPGFNYTERWYFQRLQYWDDFRNSGIRVDTTDGFYRTGEWSASTGITTRVYGTFFFSKFKGLEAVRHTMIPNVTGAYRPDFSKTGNAYQEVVINDTTGETQSFSVFNGGIFGVPGQGENASLNFSLTNILEAKIKKKKDTTNKFEKIKLLENLSISSGYNFAAESFGFSNFAIAARTRIGPFDINGNATIDPYIYTLDSTVGNTIFQTRRDRYFWNNGFKLGEQVRRYSVNISTRFNPKTFSGKGGGQSEPDPLDEIKEEELTLQEQEELRYIEENPDLYVDFTIPWNLGLRYTLSRSKEGFQEANVTQNLQFNGDLKLTNKWKVGFRSALDITTGEFSTTSISIYRDLHCWQMSLNWIPFPSRRASFTFDINVKASILQDLKLSKRNSWYDR